MNIPARIRWLAAVRSSIIQTSPTHIGKANNLEETFERLFNELVIRIKKICLKLSNSVCLNPINLY